MSDIGKRVVWESAQAVRTAVIGYVARHSWAVTNYEAYAEWVLDTFSRDQREWLVLDPLLGGMQHSSRSHYIRFTREFAGDHALSAGKIAGPGELQLPYRDGSHPVVVVDDAVGSGRTLVHLARLLSRQRTICRVVTCAARRGYDTCNQLLARPCWDAYLPGDWMVVHLRDGCPFLPHAGRAIAPSDAGVNVVARVSVSSVRGHPWQVMVLDADVREAVRTAQQRAIALLGHNLGRDATVGDLHVLGANVWATAPPGTPVSESTALGELTV